MTLGTSEVKTTAASARNRLLGITILTIVLLIGIANRFLFAAEGSTHSGVKWEYKSIQWDFNKKLEDQLNEVGKDGWELVAADPPVYSPKSIAEHDLNSSKAINAVVMPIYYFKRPLQK